MHSGTRWRRTSKLKSVTAKTISARTFGMMERGFPPTWLAETVVKVTTSCMG
jgi:hypothetical protein